MERRKRHPTQQIHLQCPLQPLGVIRMNPRRAGWVHFSQPGMHRPPALGLRQRANLPPHPVIRFGHSRQPIPQGLKIEHSPPHQQRQPPLGPNLRYSLLHISAKLRRRISLRRVPYIHQIMRQPSQHRRRGLARANIHPPIHLRRIHANQPQGITGRQLQRQCSLATGRGTNKARHYGAGAHLTAPAGTAGPVASYSDTPKWGGHDYTGRYSRWPPYPAVAHSSPPQTTADWPAPSRGRP